MYFKSALGGTTNLFGEEFSLIDVQAAQSAPTLNVSLRGQVSPGHALIGGFVVPAGSAGYSGRTSRDVLVRVVGPSLEPLGIAGAWADPDFTVKVAQFTDPPSVGHRYADWSNLNHTSGGQQVEMDNAAGVAAFKKIFDYVGAFPLLDGSKDAAQILRLPPGAYTVVASAPPGDPGGRNVDRGVFSFLNRRRAAGPPAGVVRGHVPSRDSGGEASGRIESVDMQALIRSFFRRLRFPC